MSSFFKKTFAVLLSAALLLSTVAVSVTAVESEPDYSEYYQLIIDRWEERFIGDETLDPTDPIIADKIAVFSANTRTYLENVTAATDWDTNNYVWADIDPADFENFTKPSTAQLMYARLTEMAQAYRIGESDLKGNTELRDTIFDIMDWTNKAWYNPDITQYGNWYYWQISIPQSMNDVLVLMYDELLALQPEILENHLAAIDAFPPRAGHVMTGSNLIEVSIVRAIRGALGSDSEWLQKAQSGFNNTTVYNTSKTSRDGFYEDGSFIQHEYYSYNGHYGLTYMSELTPTLVAIAGTPWDISEENKQNVCEWIYNAYEPFLYKGKVMDMVRGRGISIPGSDSTAALGSDFSAGRQIVEGIIRMAQFADDADAEYYKSLAKYHITESEDFYDFFANTNIEMYLKAKAIVDDKSVTPRMSYKMAQIFYNTDRVVQQNNNYALGLSLHSKRIAAYESINGNNLRGWYTGSGMLYIYNNDLNQFYNHYWPTVDSLRLPGTTVVSGDGVTHLPRDTGAVNSKGNNAFAGGTEIFNLYATAGMHLMPTGQTLNAKKSYFMFDNEVVALGTEISAKEGTALETTIENRMLNAAGDNAFTVDGVAQGTELCDTTNVVTTKHENAKWAHLAGSVQNSDLGFYFPSGATFNSVRQTRTGCWYDIDKYYNTEDRKVIENNNYLTMYYDHGAQATNGEYSYVIIPNASAEETAAYSENADIEILANNSDVQAVIDNTINVTGANFWNYKEATVNKNGAEWITANAPSSVMVAQQNGELTISVSDPTQENTGVVCVEVSAGASEVISADEGVTVLQTGPSVMIAVDVNGSKGKTFTVTLKEGEPADDTLAAPEILSNNQLVIRENVAYTEYLEVAGTRPVSFKLEGAPDSITLDRFGCLNIPADLGIGNYTFTVTATNECGSDVKEYTLMKRNSVLVSEWKLDEGEGTTITDSIGTVTASSIANGAAWTADGYSGSALQFAAPEGSAAAPVALAHSSSTLQFPERIEIDFQVSFDESPENRTQLILEKRPVDDYVPYAIRVSSEGKIGFCWNNVWYESESLDWDTDTWYRIYVRHDGQKIVFERNGVQCGLIPNADTCVEVKSYFAIGAGRTSDNTYFVGRIDEVSLALPNEKSGLNITSVNSAVFIPNNITTHKVAVNDSENTVNFALIGAPEGITIDENGVISLAGEVAAGKYSFYVTASYTDEVDAIQSFSLTVTKSIDAVSPSKSVLYYNFNEGSGTAIHTNSTISPPTNADYNANITDSVEWVEGFVGSAVKFDALTDRLGLNKNVGQNAPGLGMSPYASSSGVGTAAEYDFWVKFNVDPKTHEQYIFHRNHGTATIPYAVKVTTEGKLAFAWCTAWVESESLDWNTDEWYHINIVHKRDKTVTLKRDGEVVGTGTVSNGFVGTDGIFTINYSSHSSKLSSANYFNGVIDELYLGALGGGEEIRLRSKVTFDTGEGSAVEPQYVYLNDVAVAPETPTRSGYKFSGWYTDAAYTTEYDFAAAVTGELKLYARWIFTGDVMPSKSVIYYNFNEGTGTAVNTISTIAPPTGADYNATISSSVEWVEGFVGTALKFDALSDTLKMNKNAATINAHGLGMSPYEGTNLASGAEYDFWVKFNVDPATHEQYIFHRRHGTASIPYAVKVTTEGKLAFAWCNTWVESGSLDWNTDEWYHINILHKRDATVTLKRDGEVVGTGTVGKSIIGTQDVFVMNTGNKVSSTNYFNGVIDELYLGAVGGGEEIRLRSKVSFNTGEGSAVAPQYVSLNKTATEPAAPTLSGYKFEGWYTDADYTAEYDFSTVVTDEVTLYAKWTIGCDQNDPNSHDMGEYEITPATRITDGIMTATCKNGCGYTDTVVLKATGTQAVIDAYNAAINELTVLEASAGSDEVKAAYTAAIASVKTEAVKTVEELGNDALIAKLSEIVKMAKIQGGMLNVKFQLKANTTAESETTNLRLVSSIDTLNYQQVGFVITIDGNDPEEFNTNKVYETISGTVNGTDISYTVKDFYVGSNYFFTVEIRNIPKADFATNITVQAYYVDNNGEIVYGVEKVRSINDFINNSAIS